jgi:hypothetical protein
MDDMCMPACVRACISTWFPGQPTGQQFLPASSQLALVRDRRLTARLSPLLPPALLQVNVCKKKALTNMRASGKDATVVISEPIPVTLDYALEVGAGWWAAA